MSSPVRTLLIAWWGYPGRYLLLLATLLALAWGAWISAEQWRGKLQLQRTALEAELRQLQADGHRLEPGLISRDHRVLRAWIDFPDSSVSTRPQESSAPFWLPREAWALPLANGSEMWLEIAPFDADALVALVLDNTAPALLFALGLALLMAPWLQRPLSALSNWLEQLDHGQFKQTPPELAPPLDAMGAQLRVLAERLRHTRAALAERQSASDRQYRDKIRRLQAELDQLKLDQDAQSALGDARGELLRTMSHEMRTPLTAIIGYADLLGGNDSNPESAEYAGVISRSARNLLGMINNLLDLARIEAGHLQAQIGHFDLTELVEDTVALLAPLAFDKKLELNTLIYHDVPARLVGDSLRIAQILTNLLSNAIKYTDDGEVIVRVLHDRGTNDRLSLRLEVEDTGRGLDHEQQQKLFQAWRRFEVAGSTAGGSGLGLAIVHKLLDLLGGHIEVESTPGKGSCFSAIIPCDEDLNSPRILRWDALRGLKIWACESHGTAARSLTHLLTFWEVEHRLWPHMAELHDALVDAPQRPAQSLLLLGLDTRGENASIVNDILSLPLSQRPPALVMVPSIDARTHRLWRERGAQAVLAKAVQRSSLYDALAQVADQRREPQKALANLPVLVADNNRAGLRILQTQLEKLGAQVHCVENGAQALDLWSEQDFDLALLDLHMPELNGRECAQQMRACDRNKKATLVGMSAWLDAADEAAWREAGVDAVLIKPFDMERLLRTLRQSRSDSIGSADAKASAGSGLIQDEEMASLLREELPQQWSTLDKAFISGNFSPVRDAAHQLHGTAAFFHLQPLQTELAQFERRLVSLHTLNDPQFPEYMARIQQGVRDVLAELEPQ